jgi:hypothetical protein
MPVILQSPTPAAAQLALAGLNHAGVLLRDLVRRNPEYLSYPVETGAFAFWLYEDNPEFTVALKESDSVRYFERRLGRYLALAERSVKLFRATEKLVEHASSRRSAQDCANERLSQALAKTFPGWNTADVQDTVADAALVMQSLRNFEWICNSEARLALAPERHRVANLSPALMLAREQAEAQPDTCFLLHSSELPDTMRELVAERYCVVVPLAAVFDESWIFHSSTANFSFDPLVFTDAPTCNDVRMMLTAEERVMFDYEALAGSVFRHFRAELPVVYASRSSCTLVTYPIQPFRLASGFHIAHTELDIGGFFDSKESFENQVRDLHRDRLPRHAYVIRAVHDLTAENAGSVEWPILPHWTRDDIVD